MISLTSTLLRDSLASLAVLPLQCAARQATATSDALVSYKSRSIFIYFISLFLGVRRLVYLGKCDIWKRQI